MNSQKDVEISVHLDESGAPASMNDEVRLGLGQRPRRIPSKYFYDERGSDLFEQITRLPEYYLTRAEFALLEKESDRIARLCAPAELLELGSGSSRKSRLLIDAAMKLGSLQGYVALDVSQEIAERSTQRLAAIYPTLKMGTVVADFDTDLHELHSESNRLVAFLGSTLGNHTTDAAVRLLKKFAALIDAGGWLLLGTDLVKDRDVLEAAYNDSQGVTAEFNRNILNVLNNLLDGDFVVDDFEHVAFYNENEERIESYLESSRRQQVRLNALDLDFTLERGERMLTEVSCKYTRPAIEAILARAGLQLEHWMTDPQQSYALSLSRLV